MNTTSLTLPTVHLNGTSRQMLADGYAATYQQLNAALKAFASVEFNARDYYVQGPDAFNRARRDRDEQLQKLRDVIAYIEQHLIHLGE